MPGKQTTTYHQPSIMPWSLPQYQPVMPKQHMLSPALQFFTAREDGSLVPLVPVDELPSEIRLVGVPLRLSASQTKGMTFVGCLGPAGRKFSYDRFVDTKEQPINPSMTAMKYMSQPEMAARTNGVPQVANMQSFNSQPVHVQPLHVQPFNSQPVNTPISDPEPRPEPASAPTAGPAAGPLATSKHAESPKPKPKSKPLYNERPLPPSGVEPDPKKKVYCTYWIQHASCNFAQQGCLYKHEMPDLQTLKSIGIYKYPMWWQKQQARKRTSQRAERDGSSSEWEEVGRQQVGISALHKDEPVRVRVPSSRFSSTQVAKQGAQKRAQPAPQKVAAAPPSGPAAAAASSESSSPRGGIKLGAAKMPVRGPPSLLAKKQTLESPIEENLIDFDILIPSSSSDFSSQSLSSPELPANQRPKDNSKIASVGGVPVSCVAHPERRLSNTARNRRGSADKKTGVVVTPTKAQGTNGRVDKGKGTAEHGVGMSRRGKPLGAVSVNKAKAPGEDETRPSGTG